MHRIASNVHVIVGQDVFRPFVFAGVDDKYLAQGVRHSLAELVLRVKRDFRPNTPSLLHVGYAHFRHVREGIQGEATPAAGSAVESVGVFFFAGGNAFGRLAGGVAIAFAGRGFSSAAVVRYASFATNPGFFVLAGGGAVSAPGGGTLALAAGGCVGFTAKDDAFFTMGSSCNALAFFVKFHSRSSSLRVTQDRARCEKEKFVARHGGKTSGPGGATLACVFVV